MTAITLDGVATASVASSAGPSVAPGASASGSASADPGAGASAPAERVHLGVSNAIDDDGWPRVVPTWFIRQDDEVVFTPRSPAAFLANLRRDRRIGLCIDVGHTARAGVDPAESILKCQDRLYDLHMKDISALGNKNTPIEGGRGILDSKSILAALLKIKFQGLVGFEYEKDAKDPVPGLAESVGYIKGVLAGM